MSPGGHPRRDWDPDLYRAFEDQRTRPARDLLAEIGPGPFGSIVDLGCGPGNSTELLALAFSKADVTGVDTSDAMLASARLRLPHIRFIQGDAASFVPATPPDVIFANAVLQWVSAHADLLPRLVGLVRPGGTLAIQMPDNLDEATHVAMHEVAMLPAWADRIGDVRAARQATVLPAQHYYDLLSPLCGSVDIWRTAYHHPMPDARSIVTWVRSTGLRPFLDPLSDAERLDFLGRYEARIEAAYPARADGQRLLVFPRLFIVARRRVASGPSGHDAPS